MNQFGLCMSASKTGPTEMKCKAIGNVNGSSKDIYTVHAYLRELQL